MAVYRKKPAAKPAWPPKGHAKRVQVTQADDWWILAAKHGRSDPWDIIVYNFDTRDPNEVNWYLYHWVGCRTTTKDGKNYEFGAPAGTKTWFGSFPARPIWDKAWPIASSIASGNPVDYGDAKKLKEILMRTGPYRGTDPNRGTDHDGIR